MEEMDGRCSDDAKCLRHVKLYFSATLQFSLCIVGGSCHCTCSPLYDTLGGDCRSMLGGWSGKANSTGRMSGHAINMILAKRIHHLTAQKRIFKSGERKKAAAVLGASMCMSYAFEMPLSSEGLSVKS